MQWGKIPADQNAWLSRWTARLAISLLLTAMGSWTSALGAPFVTNVGQLDERVVAYSTEGPATLFFTNDAGSSSLSQLPAGGSPHRRSR